MSSVLFVAPHPDDETLGCGGAILKHKAAGDRISWLIVTVMSEEQGYRKAAIERRSAEIERVEKAYAFDRVLRLRFPTMELDKVPARTMVDAMGRAVYEEKPSVIYVPCGYDVHSDHRVTFNCLMAATKTFRVPFVKRVLMYETQSETDFSPPLPSHAFVPTGYADITPHLSRKIEIMRLYKGEMGVHPFPRSPRNIRALASIRGATAGVPYAEAFVILKDIW